MAALLLALLLCLLLDQNDRSQRLAQAIAARSADSRAAAIAILLLSVVIAAVPIALAGAWLAATMAPRPRLLFFALSLIFGGIALLWPARAPGDREARAARPPALPLLALRLLVARLTERASFALLGVSVLTQAPGLAAAGASLGGFAALLPPMLIGPAYARAVPLKAIAHIGGALLVIAGAVCALNALMLL